MKYFSPTSIIFLSHKRSNNSQINTLTELQFSLLIILYSYHSFVFFFFFSFISNKLTDDVKSRKESQTFLYFFSFPYYFQHKYLTSLRRMIKDSWKLYSLSELDRALEYIWRSRFTPLRHSYAYFAEMKKKKEKYDKVTGPNIRFVSL